MRVLAIDPGGTSGFALYQTVPAKHFESWAVEGQMPAVERARMEMSKRVDILVVEEFKITAATGRKTRGGSNTAIEIIGALRWIAHARNIPFVIQTPSDALSFMTDAKLKRLGLYTPGPDHARDATRHLVLYLVREGLLTPERLLPSVEATREET